MAARDSGAGAAVAASVGASTWRSWAGRRDGGDGYEFGDLLFGAKLAVCYHWRNRARSSARPSARPCPVCFDAPEVSEDVARTHANGGLAALR